MFDFKLATFTIVLLLAPTILCMEKLTQTQKEELAHQAAQRAWEAGKPEIYLAAHMNKSDQEKYTRAKSLLEAGADVNARDPQSGMTPLMAAATTYGRAGGNPKTIQLLLDHGANVNAIIVTPDGRTFTALDLAGDSAEREILLRHGAKTGAQMKS